MNENLENIPRYQLLNFIDQLRSLVKCGNPLVHIRTNKKTSFLINSLQQTGITPGLGYASRSPFVDLLEEGSKKVMSIPKFNLPVSKMGDYQSFLATKKDLRSIEEDTTQQRLNNFGSPFRMKKIQDRHKLMKNMGSVDEILLSDDTTPQSSASSSLKRKMSDDDLLQSVKRKKTDLGDDLPHDYKPQSYLLNETSNFSDHTHHHDLLQPQKRTGPPVSRQKPYIIHQEQKEIINNIRRYFVDNFLRKPNRKTIETELKLLVEKVGIEQRGRLLDALLSEVLMYKDIRLVKMLNSLRSFH
jgi:hypothetical protein